MIRDRVVTGAIVAALAVIAIGGAFLYAKQDETSAANSRLVCALGRAIFGQPIQQNHSETDQEFRQRVKGTEDFIGDIQPDLQNCGITTTLQFAPGAKDVLGEKGVGAGNGNRSPSGLPGPPHKGGRTKPPRRGSLRPPQTPSAPVSPPRTPVPLGPLEKPACDLTGALNVPACK